MEEHFVTYEQALALKELGFDKPCWCYFVNDVFFDSMFPKDYDYFEHMNKKMEYTLAPLKSQVFKWFRENYKIQSLIQEYLLNTYMYTIDDGINSDISVVGFETYEEAESACIDKLIESIKEKKS